MESTSGVRGHNTVFEAKLSVDASVCGLIQQNVMKECYTELGHAQILPTAKKETKYLLGSSDARKGKNACEVLIEELCGPQEKPKEAELVINKRNIHQYKIEEVERPKEDTFGGSFEDLIKMYETDKGRQVMRVKTTNTANPGRNLGQVKEWAVNDETPRTLIDKYFEENKMALDFPWRLDDFQARAVYHLEKKEVESSDDRVSSWQRIPLRGRPWWRSTP